MGEQGKMTVTVNVGVLVFIFAFFIRLNVLICRSLFVQMSDVVDSILILSNNKYHNQNLGHSVFPYK